MNHDVRDLAKAAVDAAFERLETNGLGAQADRFGNEMRREIGVRQGALKATLVTPTGDAGATAEKVKASLEKKFDRPVELVQRADKSLLGGTILEFGDERIDLSVRGALERAKTHMDRSS